MLECGRMCANIYVGVCMSMCGRECVGVFLSKCVGDMCGRVCACVAM